MYAVLPILTPTNPPGTGGSSSLPSAISLNPTVAAQQIDRIFAQGNDFVLASSINDSTTRSLQAFTELQYVETANQVINEQLENMKAALETTQGAINNLNQLQQLHNKIQVTSRNFTYDLMPTIGEISANPVNLELY